MFGCLLYGVNWQVGKTGKERRGRESMASEVEAQETFLCFVACRCLLGLFHFFLYIILFVLTFGVVSFVELERETVHC